MKKLLTALVLLLVTAVWAGDFEDTCFALKLSHFITAAP